MATTGLGLLIEEHRGEIASAWRTAVERELGVREPGCSFAVVPMLREMALMLGAKPDAHRRREALTRCAVLVRSSAESAQLAREFKLLRRCLWLALRARGAPVSHGDRQALDEWLGDALAEALERLERVRLRAASFQQPALVPALARRVKPPPLPRRAGAPARKPAPRAQEPALQIEPLDILS